jgi:hypothetical protein
MGCMGSIHIVYHDVDNDTVKVLTHLDTTGKVAPIMEDITDGATVIAVKPKRPPLNERRYSFQETGEKNGDRAQIEDIEEFRKP